jgi:PAS domain S-box-containing protein
MAVPELLFRSAFEKSGFSLLLLDGEGHFLKGNRAIQGWLGYTAVELETLSLSQCIHPDDVANNLKLFQELMRGKRQSIQIEQRWLRRNDSPVWGRTTFMRVDAPESDAPLALVTIEDIHNRKHVEDDIQISISRLQSVLDQKHVGMMVLTRDNRVFQTNDVLQQMLGYSADELQHMIFNDLLYPADQDTRSPETSLTECRLRCKDGSALWVIMTEGAGEQGELSLRIVENIHNRKRLEASLTKTSRAYRTLRRSNHAVALANNELHLLQEACKAIVEGGRYTMAWVGMAQQDEAKSVLPVAFSGFEAGYLTQAKISWGDNERGRGPTGTAIRTGQTMVSQHIHTDPNFEVWRAEALRRGYAASVAIPLLGSDQVLGALNIYAPEADAFDPDELVLIESLAKNVVFGIMAIRTREFRERAEHALKLSEARYRIIVETAREGIVSINLDQQFTYVNPRMAEMLGYTVDELIGIPLFSFVDESSWQYVAEKLLYRLQEMIGEMEVTFRRKNGEPVHTLVSATPIVDEYGKYNGTQALITDITELKRVQAEEHEQRVLAEALRDTASALISVVNMDTVMNTILKCVARVVPSDAANIMMMDGDSAKVVYSSGYSPEQNHSLKNYRMRVADTPVLRLMYDQQLACLIPDTTTNQVWVPTPETAWVKSYLGVPIRSHGHVIGFLNIDGGAAGFFNEKHARNLRIFADQTAIAIENAQLYEEITRHAALLEQRVRERTAELDQALRRVEAILNNSNDMIALCLPDGTISLVNPAFYSVFGNTPEDTLSQPLAQFIAPAQFEELNAAFAQTVASSHSQRLDIVAQRSGESPLFDVEMVLSPIIEQPGQVSSVVCSMRDVTERKAAELQRQQLLDHAMELNTLKSRYVSMAAHDLRNPLASILGSVETLQRYGDRLSEDRKTVKYQMVYTDIRKMVDLLNDFLTLGKVEAQAHELQCVPVNMKVFCEELVESLRQSSGTGRQIDFTFDGDWEMLAVDEKLLWHIVSNLLSNALKYSPADRPVTFGVSYRDALLKIVVEDQGIGIPLADQAQLFEPFQRASNARQIAGTGLGLAIVKQSVERHGGTIQFLSREGVGTSFTVTIPV